MQSLRSELSMSTRLPFVKPVSPVYRSSEVARYVHCLEGVVASMITCSELVLLNSTRESKSHLSKRITSHKTDAMKQQTNKRVLYEAADARAADDQGGNCAKLLQSPKLQARAFALDAGNTKVAKICS